jgi:hypothetical protein
LIKAPPPPGSLFQVRCVAGLAASEDVLDRCGHALWAGESGRNSHVGGGLDRFLRGGDLGVELTRSIPVGPVLADDPRRVANNRNVSAGLRQVLLRARLTHVSREQRQILHGPDVVVRRCLGGFRH